MVGLDPRGRAGAGRRAPGCSVADRLDHPVVAVALEDVEIYADLGEKALPAEAEW